MPHELRDKVYENLWGTDNYGLSNDNCITTSAQLFRDVLGFIQAFGHTFVREDTVGRRLFKRQSSDVSSMAAQSDTFS
jgi:hypothetical protein